MENIDKKKDNSILQALLHLVLRHAAYNNHDRAHTRLHRQRNQKNSMASFCSWNIVQIKKKKKIKLETKNTKQGHT